MINQEYLDKFENNLTNELLRLCTSYKMLEGTLLATDDIDGEWQRFAPEYIADAVKEISSYPTVSVAWAAYIGMAVAAQWDSNWEAQKTIEYKHYYGSQGFDDLDEHILFDLLKMPADSKEAKDTEEMEPRFILMLLLNCAAFLSTTATTFTAEPSAIRAR